MVANHHIIHMIGTQRRERKKDIRYLVLLAALVLGELVTINIIVS